MPEPLPPHSGFACYTPMLYHRGGGQLSTECYADLRRMGTPDDAQKKAAATYNAASDYFDNPATSFWERYGRRPVERLRPPAGARVLDVCCGSGASAIPAAEMVGAGGFVLGVDLAASLLELARRKAKLRGLENIEFR